jgi:hypothetical protein
LSFSPDANTVSKGCEVGLSKKLEDFGSAGLFRHRQALPKGYFSLRLNAATN